MAFAPATRLAALMSALSLVVGLAARADAADAQKPAKPERPANVVVTAAAEPDRVAPGGRGVLVLTGTLREHFHAYAGKRFKVNPVPAKGVTYGAIETSKPVLWTDPDLPGDPPSPVWFDRVVVRIPFTLAADATLPVTVAANVRWNGCDPRQCYAEEGTKEPVGVEIRAPDGVSPAPPAMGGDAALPPDEPRAPPRVPDVEAPPAPPAPPVPREPAEPAAPTAPPVAPSPATPVDVAANPDGTDARQPSPTATASARFPEKVLDTDETQVTAVVLSDVVVVTFSPKPGHHLYPLNHAGQEGIGITVEGVASEGVTWGRVVAPLLEGDEVREPYSIRLPFTEAATGSKSSLAVTLSWQACLDTGTCRAPEAPRRLTLRRDGTTPSWEETLDGVPAMADVTGTTSPTRPPASGTAGRPSSGSVAATGLLFEVVESAKKKSWVQERWEQSGMLILLLLFSVGLGLAFTPCVLPIIPITVSLIGGGRADLPKSRLTLLLCCYVLGLSLTFASMGVAAAAAGASLAAAFQSPVAIWVIAGLFWVLSFGMFGVYELQPPAWAQKKLGSSKGGSPVAAFLFGAVAAVIASPCTGPVIAGLIVLTAQLGNMFLGFLFFFALGLGMGAVFFAAGSLNFLARPGPWMVWVRYTFGILLVGAALYYLRSADKVGETLLFAIGVGTAVLVAVLVARHLIAKEGEERPSATRRSVKLGAMTVAATFAVALLTGWPSRSGHLSWIDVTSREQMVREVETAKQSGKATIVDVWATWCRYCVAYDRLIDGSPALLDRFHKLHRVRMNLSDADRPWEAGLREGLGVPTNQQPYMVLIDSKGRIQRDLDVEWERGESEEKLLKKVKALLDE